MEVSREAAPRLQPSGSLGGEVLVREMTDRDRLS